MALSKKAPRGGLVETLAGRPRILVLTNAEIERFEDLHRGIFALWNGFQGRGTAPTSREVKDLMALALVGGGLKDAEADAVIEDLEPEHLLNLYRMSQGVLGAAFMPDVVDELNKPARSKKKKPAKAKAPSGSTSET